jgi:quinoprotein dehydrogenase-associated probable ABC transporter substrate-binding protein
VGVLAKNRACWVACRAIVPCAALILVPLAQGFADTGAEAPKALRVCADPNNLPFTNRAGQGFENRIADLIAHDLGVPVEYTWWPQRRGFIRNTLKAGRCDVVMGLPAGFEMAELTAPYYASTYVFVTRRGSGLENVRSLDDPRLRRVRIGLHVIGDDYSNVPPADALAARGIRSNVIGYSIYGDYSKPNPPSQLIEAVAHGDVDIAIAWGPLGGYYAARAKPALVVTTMEPDKDHRAIAPLEFAIAMGVRHGDHALRMKLQAALERHRRDIAHVLDQYHVPRASIAAAVQRVASDQD